MLIVKDQQLTDGRSSGQPAAQRIGALRLNDCRWGKLAQNFSRKPRPVPS
jgi:hypothetical protein